MLQNRRIDVRGSRQQGFDDDITGQFEFSPKALGRISQETSAGSLSIKQLMQVVATHLKSDRRRVFEHVGRMISLAEIRLRDPKENAAVDRLAQRVNELEAELSKLRRKLLA